MNTIKCFSVLIASSLLSTTILAQNITAPAPVAELDVKPVVAKPLANNIPAPGTRVVAVEPVDALKAAPQPKALKMEAASNDLATQPTPTQATDVMPIKAEAVALQIPDISAKQAKMTDQQKATMAGKGIRPKTIDQTNGVTESKLTPATAIKPIEAVKPVLAPLEKN